MMPSPAPLRPQSITHSIYPTYEMALRLRYGVDSTASVEIDPDKLVANCDGPRGGSLVPLAAAIDHALAEPLEFPPLAQAVVPGDKVGLALSADVPQAAAIVERTVAALLAAGVLGDDITLVAPTGVDAAGIAVHVARRLGDIAIRHEIHDPSRRDSLSYLAADAAGHPIYINRTLHEADAVVAIGCLQLEGAPGYFAARSVIVPAFAGSPQKTAKSSKTLADLAERRRKRPTHADDVAWLLGLQFTIQVVPDGSGGVLQVLAGELEAVFRAGRHAYDEAWRYVVPLPSDLVVATIGGEPAQQTWNSVGRALRAAAPALKAGGSVVICSDLDEQPGTALQLLVGNPDLDDVLEQVDRLHSEDAATVGEIARALQRGRVYLISRLEDELVEDLGIAPLEAGQLSRVVSRHNSCLVLGSAQFSAAQLAGDQLPEATTGNRKSRL